MKRTLALILSLLLLFTATAVAENTNENMEIEYKVPNQQWTSGTSKVDKLEGAYTELWLQVEAKGQIDVTVPLVLVFKTDVEGGKATTATNYKITNNSTGIIVVTNVAKTNGDLLEAGLSQVAYTATPERNEFAAQLLVDKQYVQGGQTDFTWDTNATTATGSATSGGVFFIGIGNGANSTEIKASLKTGPLGFVTKTDDSSEYGVKLLTVTYTVAIDQRTVVDDVITTAVPATPGG